MDVELLVTEGLGDNSYLLCSDGQAALVDPQRDAARFLARAELLGVSVRHVLETHVHNDYVSGALEVRAATGAEVVAPVGGGYAFEHRAVGEGDEVSLGDLTVVALQTPGHTPEHLSYLVRQAGSDRPVAVFTGGSLMVGGAGRTDLLGADRADELTRAQYRSLRRLGQLPGDTDVLPTHGAGSFCGAGPPPKTRTSTIAAELAQNPALASIDEEAFVRQQLSGLLAYPTYYASMGAINRAGARLLSEVSPPAALSPHLLEARVRSGAHLVDARGRLDFAAAHIPGSLNVEMDKTFGSYVGWLVPFNDPVVLVLPEPQDRALEDGWTQLVRIGYERVEGYLDGGVAAWEASGRTVRSYRTADVQDLCAAMKSGTPPKVLDVRQRTEWDAGRIDESEHLFVGDLPRRLAEVPRSSGEVWAICASGHRSSMAASILDREGVPVRLVAKGGVRDFLDVCGH